MRFAAYVSANATRLLRYLATYEDRRINLCGVLHDGSEDNQLLRSVTQELGVEYRHVKLTRLTGRETGGQISAELLEFLGGLRIDYCFCFGSRILGGDLLVQYKNRIINFHPSLLPSYPGINAIDKALDKGAFVLGNTAHFVDDGIDTGPIIMQNVLPVHAYRTYDDLLDLQLPMLHQIAGWLEEGRVRLAGGKVIVEEARYSSCFIPCLENDAPS